MTNEIDPDMTSSIDVAETERKLDDALREVFAQGKKEGIPATVIASMLRGKGVPIYEIEREQQNDQ